MSRSTPAPSCRAARVIGNGCEIGPDTRLVDCVVADDCVIENSVGRDAEIGAGARRRPVRTSSEGSSVAAGQTTGSFYTAVVD